MRRLEDFVPKSHPLRSIRQIANEALVKMDRLFSAMYEADIKGGRPSIAPEKLLRAMLLQVLYSILSGCSISSLTRRRQSAYHQQKTNAQHTSSQWRRMT